MKKVLNVGLLCLVLALVYATFSSVNAPLDFDKDRQARDNEVIARLTDIRTAQVEFRAQNRRYASNFDELISFLQGKMTVVRKSYMLNDNQLIKLREYKVKDTNPKNPDEMAFSEDEAEQIVLDIIKDSKLTDSKDKSKKNKAIERIKELDACFRADTTWTIKVDTVFSAPGVVERLDSVKKMVVNHPLIAQTYHRDTTLVAYVDTLFHNPSYDLQQLRYIPFSKGEDGKPVEFFMKSDSIKVNTKAGGYVHVFEARADFTQYLRGLNEQELANYLLKVIESGNEIRIENANEDGIEYATPKRIPCRKVGDLEKNNNNAGNWS